MNASDWISLLYRADVLGVGNFRTAMTRLREQIATDATQRQYCTDRLNALREIDSARASADFATKKELEYLTEALA